MRTSDTTTFGTLPNATKPSVGMVQAQVVLPVLQVLQAQAVGGGSKETDSRNKFFDAID